MKLDSKFHGVVVKNDGTVVPPDQWVVFLATDNALPEAILAYVEELRRLSASEEQIQGMRDLYSRLIIWREEHKHLCKVPDVRPGQLL
jgi:hypothetical protein